MDDDSSPRPGDSSAARLAAALERWVAAAPPGARLPSTRSLAAEHRAGPATVQRAVQLLVARGLVETRPGAGSFTRPAPTARPVDHTWQTAALHPDPPARAPGATVALRTATADQVALHAAYPATELLPGRLVRTALGRAARGAAALERPPSAGLPALRSWFAAELAERAPAGVTAPTAADVVVLPGSQSGLSSVFRALVGQGRPLLVESPTYWGALSAARHAGVRVVPVPSGPAGPDPAQLDRVLAETGARAVYAQPRFANPTGALWSPSLGAAVLEVVRRHRAFLVEDDWAHDLGIDAGPVAAPLAALDDAGHVVHLRSLSKSVSPSLRVAAVVSRGPARQRLLADQAAESMYVSGLLQEAALEVVTHPGWGTHRRALRDRLRERRDLLLGALAEHAPSLEVEHVPRGGLSLWVRLPPGVDPEDVARRAEQRDVLVAPGDAWFPAEPPAGYLRVSFSGPDPASFVRGAQVLGEVSAC
ncbi:PLP-dependent aminotransferase family protein [Nocardioides nanhaiensis]|uniref:PLP-dependent aminotransferase family protein n=1 Tax=Nocardioides nanhaiensis TaxID=1476871 RepID=A0ABP8VQF3_9ACTN